MVQDFRFVQEIETLTEKRMMILIRCMSFLHVLNEFVVNSMPNGIKTEENPLFDYQFKENRMRFMTQAMKNRKDSTITMSCYKVSTQSNALLMRTKSY